MNRSSWNLVFIVGLLCGLLIMGVSVVLLFQIIRGEHDEWGVFLATSFASIVSLVGICDGYLKYYQYEFEIDKNYLVRKGLRSCDQFDVTKFEKIELKPTGLRIRLDPSRTIFISKHVGNFDYLFNEISLLSKDVAP